MYEMCVGPETKTGALVWHVVERRQGNSLCGADLSGTPRADQSETDRHCLPCMARFQESLETGTGAGAN
ncbi:hypothetical protein M2271_000238 [Streptomyces sp. LBL]|uniref:hypothetical protein n=1 Tax=Streptomyces sp. LBL TaxID=2940562 RepID=UPI0024752D54|nr:hypothetical protein [Streptomyces sp. LBL]MDH6622451.1 hypothetical protein [Streptomyces sp. LBL]